MLAMDVKPSRLEFAKSELLAMLPDLKGDRVGLIVFEGDAFVQCPLTLDYAALSLFLDDVSAGAISRPGTNLAKAIEMASDNFAKKSTSREKIMVVFSDGESFEEDPVVAARNAAQKGDVIYTVALGSTTGEPIPILDASGQVVGYKKDRNNNVVLTKTNVTVLRQVAEVSKGACLEGGNFGVSEQVCQLIAKRDRFDLGGVQSLSFNEKYQPFLLLAFLCFFLEFVIPERRRFYAS
jgi:Ca-activated chloride channel family protein